jgi:hypothetical protein
VFTKANIRLAIAAFSTLISACAALPPDDVDPLPSELSQREEGERQAQFPHLMPHPFITVAAVTHFQR